VSSAASATFAENATGTVYTATATDADAGSTFTYALGGTDAARFAINASSGAVTFISSPDYEAPIDAGGNNVYDITVTASDGVNTSAAKAVAITVTNVGEQGDAVISLGAGNGQLIFGVQVESKWYYHWDRNSSGTADAGDTLTHDALDGIFNQNISGVTEAVGNAVGAVGDTDNTYRYATLNGVQVALPTYGSSMSGNNALPLNLYKNGTSATATAPDGATADNPTYEDLLAIWDNYNGTGTGTGTPGVPPGWQSYRYWSATPSASGHASVYLVVGYVYDNGDTGNSYVALQVL